MNTTASKTETISLQINLSNAKPSEAVPMPHVREAGETLELDSGIANRGFTLVLPAFKDETFDELFITFSTLDYSSITNANLIPFISGQASIDTVTEEQIVGRFKPGETAKIRVFLRVYGDIWVLKESPDYKIV
ncbi:hypothetical protein K5D69_11570 [Pseudomonas cichorii]|uniref:hypothetical protein n=1 Tax=Pseudomonas cichorii TaxID=36746 RepID=UPI001C89E7EA|nr:hypothetical protein [Pseudomonas cichorii]MBX8515332.1 hypothetical protein [Pseudomonas cichorii]